MRIHTRFWMDETCTIRPCQLMQRESGVSIPACCLLGEMKIFTLLRHKSTALQSLVTPHLLHLSPKTPNTKSTPKPSFWCAHNQCKIACFFHFADDEAHHFCDPLDLQGEACSSIEEIWRRGAGCLHLGVRVPGLVG